MFKDAIIHIYITKGGTGLCKFTLLFSYCLHIRFKDELQKKKNDSPIFFVSWLSIVLLFDSVYFKMKNSIWNRWSIT